MLAKIRHKPISWGRFASTEGQTYARDNPLRKTSRIFQIFMLPVLNSTARTFFRMQKSRKAFIDFGFLLFDFKY